MNRLLQFLVRYKHVFLFLFLELGALLLVFSYSIHKKALSLSLATSIIGGTTETINGVYSYIDLKEKNQTLLLENAHLNQEVLNLKQQFESYRAQNTFRLDSLERLFQTEIVTTAHILNRKNSLGKNYFIINKGKTSGIETNMGVMSEHSVVGSIMSVSDNYAIVIPIINPDFRLNCIESKTKTLASLCSELGSTAQVSLIDIPKHLDLHQGDTITTGRDSYIFPEGLLVGAIEQKNISKGRTDTYSVKLFTDFNKLQNIYILKKHHNSEKKQLEMSLEK